MKEIWKYPLAITDMQKIYMPVGAKFLDVQMQDEIPCAWAIIDPYVKREPRTILIFGTGNPFSVSEKAEYIGTIQQGQLVWHVFADNQFTSG